MQHEQSSSLPARWRGNGTVQEACFKQADGLWHKPETAHLLNMQSSCLKPFSYDLPEKHRTAMNSHRKGTAEMLIKGRIWKGFTKINHLVLWPAVSESLSNIQWFLRKTKSIIWAYPSPKPIKSALVHSFTNLETSCINQCHQMKLKLIVSVKNHTWIMILLFCGQILFHKIRVSYPVFENGGIGHQGVPPFSCFFSSWNNEKRLLGGPAAALAEVSGTHSWKGHWHQGLWWCSGVCGPWTLLGCLWARMAELGGSLHWQQGPGSKVKDIKGRKKRVGRMPGLTWSAPISISIQNSTILILRFRQFKHY